ncbi:MAG: hypothetical protein ACRDG5_08100 [Anaerolineales bacterium]
MMLLLLPFDAPSLPLLVRRGFCPERPVLHPNLQPHPPPIGSTDRTICPRLEHLTAA